MCPGTLAIAAAAASAAGSEIGAISAGNAANYQAKIAANNSKVAQQDAAYSAEASSAQVQQAGLKARAQGGALKAAAAAHNVDVATGSAADVQTSEREIGQLDTETVANRGAEAVYGYQAQAANYRTQSNLDRSEANFDYVGGTLKAAGQLGSNPAVDSAASSAIGSASSGASSLLSSAPSVPGPYAWMQGTGGWGDSVDSVGSDPYGSGFE